MNSTDIIGKEEGLRLTPYHCSLGYPTIGYGKKLGPKHASLSMYTFSITEEMAKLWLEEEIEFVKKELDSSEIYSKLDPVRQDILVSMAYQMGIGGLLKFKKMWAALDKGDFIEAARQALDSRWAKQTFKRANRHAGTLKSGVHSTYYS